MAYCYFDKEIEMKIHPASAVIISDNGQRFICRICGEPVTIVEGCSPEAIQYLKDKRAMLRYVSPEAESFYPEPR
jgi:hypothetical protein